MQDSQRRREGVEVEREAVSPGEDEEHLGGRQGSDLRVGTSSKGLCTKEASEERRVTASGKGEEGQMGRGNRSVEETHPASGPLVQGVLRRKQSPFKD